ncbi:MAG: HAD-IC family P-type ATPase, partial [Thermoguttaceae bacterium]|nr:HAD-IC family P-type ATPase [Thermoguttaceae bacterium]
QKILVKGSACIDTLAKISTVVFDKTGTLTRGVFEVKEAVPAPGFTRDELLNHAAHAESASSHPIAEALRRAAPGPVRPERVTDIEEAAGHGVRAQVDGREVAAGNLRFLQENNIGGFFTDTAGTVVHVAIEGRYAGMITIADQVKPDSALAVEALRREGVQKILMLTGDCRAVAEKTASLLGLDGFRAELLPDQKVAFVEELEREKPAGSRIAFVGDGINDAPVLARADLGVAMGGIGADAAIDAADAVLMTDQPSRLATAIRIAQKTLTIARQNIIFALGVKAVILTLGALGLASLWLTVFGDVGVAALATLNATRTLRADR